MGKAAVIEAYSAKCSEGAVENKKVVAEVWQPAGIQYSIGNRVSWVWVLWVSVERIFWRDSCIWNEEKNVKCKLKKWWVRMNWMANSYSSADTQIVWKVSFVARDGIKSFLFSLLFYSFSWDNLSFSSLYSKNRHIAGFDCEKWVLDTSFCG